MFQLSTRQRSSRVPKLVAAAAVVLALACGGWALVSRHQEQQADTARAQLTSLLSAKDVRVTSGSIAGSSATLVLSQIRHEGLFVAGPMPALPDGKVYELWTMRRTSTPAGTFQGGHSAVVTMPAAVLTAYQVAVTIEPAGGSAHPTTRPVLALRVPHGA